MHEFIIMVLSWTCSWGAAWISETYQVEGWSNMILRFIWLAAGLRFLLSLETLRAGAAGVDLESREHYRNLMILGMIYSLCMFLMAAGAIAWV